MRLTAVFAALVSSAAVLASRQCGSFLDVHAIIEAEVVFNGIPLLTSFPLPQTKIIPVYWNVVYKNKTSAGGFIPQKQIDDQMKVLNKGFRKTPFLFKLVNVKRVLNETWFDTVNPDSEEGAVIASEMKARLRKGDESTLNLYSVGFTDAGGLLGYATFPSDLTMPKRPLSEDGVVVHHSSLPGGSLGAYSLGGTVVHETGHWVGLYHTFQSGDCDGDGDYVDDTPAEAVPTSGCPTNKDTCPQKGLDPIHNYMDYSDDACYEEFTPGQIKRMTKQMWHYRDI